MAYICDLSPELQKKAREELNEDPERTESDIDHIREWLKKQPHINARTDDITILRFLRGCKFSLQKTKEKLDMFYTCRTMVPEWFSNRDPQEPKAKHILELGEFLPLPKHDDMGRKIVIVRPGLHDPAVISMEEVFKATHMAADVMLEEDISVVVAGISQIIDLQGVTVGHALQLTPALVKKSMTIFQDCYPLRPKGIHYINTPPSFDTVFNIFKAFMKEKIKKRVHIHGSDLTSLQKYFSKDVLPIEYGGTCGSVEEVKNYWFKKVTEKREWLLEDEKYKVDEFKRPGKPKTSSDIFGMEGSFRKLNVD